MGTVTLQMIFQDAFPTYEQGHLLPPHVRKAARALMQCRTAALGGHVQACPDGHMSRIWYNSCRHRSCPQCAYLQAERWLALQRARLLACDHYHVIFTLPHELNPLWLANVPVMTTLLFQAVRDTLGTLLADPKYLGAQPGSIAALHTWSQTLVLHPHLHCLVTGGGLTSTGQWVTVRHGFLLPARVVMAVFRGKMLDAIRQAWARGEVVLPEELRPPQFVTLLTRLGHPRKTPWNVWSMERYRHGAGVVTYLARYLCGVGSALEQGLVTNLARPEGNVTGFTDISPDLSGKRLELLKEVVPQLARVAVLWSPDLAGNPPQWSATHVAAHGLGVQLQSLEVRGAAAVEAAVAAATKDRADAVVVFSGAHLSSRRADVATKLSLPAMYPDRAYVAAGGLMSYGPNNRLQATGNSLRSCLAPAAPRA